MPELRMAALAVAFAAGILASSYVSPIALLLVAAAGWLLAVLLLRSVPRVTIAILAAVFLVGGLRYDIASRIPNNDISRLVVRLLFSRRRAGECRDVRLVCRPCPAENSFSGASPGCCA